MKFETPAYERILFSTSDVIATSDPAEDILPNEGEDESEIMIQSESLPMNY